MGVRMTCGLNEEELFILNLLYKNRCLRSDRGFSSKKLADLFRKKFGKSSEAPIKMLKNKQYIGVVKKASEKYYISDIPKTLHDLSQHGYKVIKGRERPL